MSRSRMQPRGRRPLSRLDATLERIQRWDERVCLRFNRAVREGILLRAFRAVSRLGDGLFWYALMLALLLRFGREAAPAVVHMMLVGLACTATYRALKKGTVRPRPYQVHAAISMGAAPLDRFSFPSGHALHAVAFTIVAASHYPWLAAPLALFTLLVAASRIVLGLHYPSDVLAGAFLGAVVALASLTFI